MQDAVQMGVDIVCVCLFAFSLPCPSVLSWLCLPVSLSLTAYLSITDPVSFPCSHSLLVVGTVILVPK